MTTMRDTLLQSSHIALLALLFTTACGEQIVVENTLAEISEVTPIALTSADEVSVSYLLSDEEGDDQALTVEVCEGSADSPQDCGLAFEGTGSDPVSFLPTEQGGRPLSHVFTWDQNCGRIQGDTGEIFDTTLDTTYIFRLRIKDERAEWHYSDTFTLMELGVDAISDCER